MALKPKEIKFIKAKAEGKTNIAAAQEATGLTNPNSAAVEANRMLKRANVQDELVKVFKKHGLDLDIAVAPIAKALKARKAVFNENTKQYEVGDDVDMQLKGSDRLLRLMGVGNQAGDVTINFINQSQEQRQVYDV